MAFLSNAKSYLDISRFIKVHFEVQKEHFDWTWERPPVYTTIRNVILGIDSEGLETSFRAHPESNIRGKEFGSSTDDYDLGYYISGPVMNVAISKPIRLGERFFINAEAKTTLAYAYIKVPDGHANVYNLAFHLTLGIGFDFAKPKQK